MNHDVEGQHIDRDRVSQSSCPPDDLALHLASAPTLNDGPNNRREALLRRCFGVIADDDSCCSPNTHSQIYHMVKEDADIPTRIRRRLMHVLGERSGKHIADGLESCGNAGKFHSLATSFLLL